MVKPAERMTAMIGDWYIYRFEGKYIAEREDGFTTVHDTLEAAERFVGGLE